MDPQSIAILVISFGVVGLVLVGVLAYTGKLGGPTALKVAGGLATILGAVAVGLAAGRRRGTGPAVVPPPPTPPPEPGTPAVARAVIVEDAQERIEEIEEAETDPDALERLRGLTRT